MSDTKILLTGLPGCGKTTLIRRLVSNLPGVAGGFYTQEIRQDGLRKGFEIASLEGRRGVLAHVEFRSQHKIGKYGVDLAALEQIGVDAIYKAIAERRLVVIDEIGSMEILSLKFRQAVLDALQSALPVLGTITRRRTHFIDQVKAMPNVTIVEVRPDNREALYERLSGLFQGS